MTIVKNAYKQTFMYARKYTLWCFVKPLMCKPEKNLLFFFHPGEFLYSLWTFISKASAIYNLLVDYDRTGIKWSNKTAQ